MICKAEAMRMVEGKQGWLIDQARRQASETFRAGHGPRPRDELTGCLCLNRFLHFHSLH